MFSNVEQFELKSFDSSFNSAPLIPNFDSSFNSAEASTSLPIWHLCWTFNSNIGPVTLGNISTGG